ncbi:hypothetical protein PINS_up005174 [Pythium insidiosum]|nr:hypothetical protein PINS_up005174 [Pythium insidiosum]
MSQEHALAATQQTTPSKKRRLDDTDDDATPRGGDTHVSAIIGSDPTAVHHVDNAASTSAATTTQAIEVHDLSTVAVASEGSSATPADINTAPLSSTVESPASTSTSSTVEWTWARNLQRRSGGFWADAHWYDVHLERRMPLVKPMLEELVAALPPCGGRRVIDLCAGSGRASAALLAAYPTANVTLVDASAERLALARQRILQQAGVHLTDAQLVHTRIVPELLATLSRPSASTVDVVVGCLAFHVLAERPPHYEPQLRDATALNRPPATAEAVYETLFRGVHALLQPGGHVLIADHVGQLGLYRHLALLERVGFEDVDCAWRQQDFFVIGARKPLVTAVSM